MKRFLPLLLIVTIAGFVACKGKSKEQETKEPATTEQTPAENTPKPAETANNNTPLTYTVKFAPDTLEMGKDKKFFVKVMEGSGLIKQDPDGKVLGSELTIKLRGTNRHFVSDKDAPSYSIYQPDQRLELDNGTSITCTTLPEIAPEKESSKDADMVFDLPAGAKPVKLNLYEYYSKTRYSIALTVEEKK